MSLTFLFILTIFLAVEQHAPVHGISCTRQINKCSCVTDLNGQVLDFSKLDRGGKPPFFTTSDPPNNRQFEFNPCSPFTCPKDLTAAVCGIFSNPMSFNTLGTAESAQFINTPDPYSAIIRYKGSTLMTATTVDVTFECRKTDSPLFVVKNLPNNTYFEFKLYTKYSCLNVGPFPPEGGGAPVGWIILGVLVGLVLVYLVGGMLVNGLYFKRSGVELVPNLDFWTAFGKLIGDGAVFVWVSAKGLFTKATGRGGGGGGGGAGSGGGYNPV